MRQETVAAQDIIARFAQWQGWEPESVAADATYGNGEFLQWFMERGHHSVYAYSGQCCPQEQSALRPERFTYLPESNSYRCPAGEQLNFVGLNVRNRTQAYIGSRKHCGACPQQAQCTRSTSILPSTFTNPPGNVPETWSTLRPLRTHNGKEER
jgi:hypothetical protein